MPKIQVYNNTINYKIVGDGPHTVLCLPGYLGTIEFDFDKIMSLMDPTKYRMVCWDPPGYGLSLPHDREFTKGYLKRDAEVAVDFMENLGIRRYSILGWSQGGHTGIYLAAIHPSRVISLALISVPDIWDSRAMRFYRITSSIDSWPAEKLHANLRYYKRHYLEQMTNDMAMLAEVLTRAKEDENKEACGKVTCAVLLVHSKKDFFAVDNAHRIAAKIKQTELHILNEGGHNLHLSNTDEFMKIFLDFLARVEDWRFD